MKFFNYIKNIGLNYPLIGVLILGGILRFYHLDFQSPWLDEIHTLNEANPNTSIFDLYTQIISGEQLPPLYFYLLYFCFKIFGYSVLVARFLSAIMGVATLYTMFLLGKKMFNKHIGLLASLMLCVNFFMIYYSQEARPYMFFTLFVVFSYYRLVILLNNLNLKNAILYGLASCLMFYGHFVGFFVIFAQGITVLLYFIHHYKNVEQRKTLFKYFLISFLVLVIAYIPGIDALFSVLEMKKFWVPQPKEGDLSLIYSKFFGNSEVLTFFNLIFFIGFIYTLLQIKVKENNTKLWNFLIIILWISFGVLIPVFKTYTSEASIILDRYFIALVPAIVLLLAVGLNSIKLEWVKSVLICSYVVFALLHIVYFKDYYQKIGKAQFKETTAFIVENNKKNHKVVSSLSWYLPYFFEKEGKTYDIIGSNLDDFVAKIANSKEPLEPFWYFDGHNRKYKANKKTEMFLNRHYSVSEKYNRFQAWTIYYKLKSDEIKKVEFTEEEMKALTQNKLPQLNNIEKFSLEDNVLNLKGWSLLKDLDSKETEVKVLLVNENSAFILPKLNVYRPDITNFFKLDYNADNSGYECNVDLSDYPKGNYKLGVLMENQKAGKSRLMLKKDLVLK